MTETARSTFPSIPQPEKPYPIKPHTPSLVFYHKQTCRTGAIFCLRGRDYCKRSGGNDGNQSREGIFGGFGPHLFLAGPTMEGRKVEQILKALVVNHLLMRGKEKQGARMKLFSVQGCMVYWVSGRGGQHSCQPHLSC